MVADEPGGTTGLLSKSLVKEIINMIMRISRAVYHILMNPKLKVSFLRSRLGLRWVERALEQPRLGYPVQSGVFG